MKKISLRIKIMLITMAMLIGMAICLTWTSVENAQKYYVEHKENTDYNVTRDLNGQRLESNNEQGLSVFFKLTSESATKDFIKKSLWYMIGICLVGSFILYYGIDKAIKPLVELEQKIKQINENNLNQRIDMVSRNKEIASLTHSFNTMLSRLEKAFADQKEFVANVTHELKTPLAIIKTDIDVLRLDEEPTIEEYKENLEVIEQSTQRLMDVVENLLVMMDESHDTLQEVIAVDEMIVSIVSELQNMMKQKHIAPYTICDKCYIKGNAALFYRALFNLIENAIKYNKENGQIKVCVQAQQEKISIQIADSGIGIPEQFIENIFNPFYRVESSRSRELGGSGLGLALTKQIIEKHKGCISVHSKEGEGTLFEIVISAFIPENNLL